MEDVKPNEENEFNLQVTSTQLGNLFSISPRRIAQLTTESILKKIDAKHYDLRQSILAYVEYSKDQVKKNSGYDNARTKKVQAEAEMKEIQLAKEQGQVVSIDVVGQVVGQEYSTVRTRFLGLPTRTALQLAGMSDPAKILILLEQSINEILEELTADKNYEEFTNQISGDQAKTPEASTEAESDSVG